MGPKPEFWLSLLAASFPILIPAVKFAVVVWLWEEYNVKVDRDKCTCSCFDTVSKGPYETGVAKYKHIYFNATWTTLKIWIITVIGIVALYESLKKLFVVLHQRKLNGLDFGNIKSFSISGRARVKMCLLFVISLYPNYYSWWYAWSRGSQILLGFRQSFPNN